MTEILKIAVSSGTFGKYAPKAIEKLSKHFKLINIKLSPDMSDDEVAEAIGEADGLLLGSAGRVTLKIIERTPSLKLIIKHGLGVDNIDVKAATKYKIPIINCRHTNEEISVAEYTIALLLSAARNIIKGNELVKDGKWKQRSNLIGSEIYRKTLGIIGLGAIGQRVAKMAKRGFEMNVAAYDPYVHDKVFKDLRIKREDLDTLIQESDFLTIHVPLTDETRNLINARRIKNIKSFIIINTSRGAVIDEEELAKKIKKNNIIAALDVLEREPPEINNPLLKMDNVILTPHIALYTKDALKRMDDALAEDMLKFFNGQKPLRLVNPEVFEARLTHK